MCKYGNRISQEYWLPKKMCRPGEKLYKKFAVDKCITEIVAALNDAGIFTVASCCGHGHRPGNIALRDGREFFISPDFETSRKIDKVFLINIQGEKV